jgi:phosphatidylserine decarboxylase
MALVPAGAWVFLLSFFRNPERPCQAGPGELLSPADGAVADIEEVDAPVFLEGKALRVGVFMSVFNCHVNRAPAGGTVEMVQHFPGKFFDARDERSMAENEHNFIGLRMPDGRSILVNQIAGLLARRIVCAASPGDALVRGERFGMVKFGSRLELFVPLSDGPEARVKVGEKVKAGRDVLVAYADHSPEAV